MMDRRDFTKGLIGFLAAIPAIVTGKEKATKEPTAYSLFCLNTTTYNSSLLMDLNKYKKS